jgi:hypothetical protein
MDLLEGLLEQIFRLVARGPVAAEETEQGRTDRCDQRARRCGIGLLIARHPMLKRGKRQSRCAADPLFGTLHTLNFAQGPRIVTVAHKYCLRFYRLWPDPYNSHGEA